MRADQTRRSRELMLRDGFCVVPNILTEAFVEELITDAARINATEEHHPDTRYQGTHVAVKYADNPTMRRLATWMPTREALDQLGFGDFEHGDSLLVLTKPAQGSALYWHQDWKRWKDPLSCSPWPQIMFISYYLQGTSVENGCLRVIPGSHRRRIPLHDQLVTAHEEGARFITEDDPVMFSRQADEVDVPVDPTDLVLADARLLHAAHANRTDQPRDLLLLWHGRPDTVPPGWVGEVPQVIATRDSDAEYETSRVPGDYLVAAGSLDSTDGI